MKVFPKLNDIRKQISSILIIYMLQYLSQLIALFIIVLMTDIEAQEIAFLNNEILKDTPYQPCSKISYGSFGQIFKVRDKQRQYALKIISKQKMIKEQKLHEAAIQSFTLACMKHPGIVKYFTTIETQQYICQLLEYCPYGDLFHFCKKMNKNIEVRTKRKEINIFYITQILQAIYYIHLKGIIHRDIKLENVVIGPDLNSRIIDFGTSKPIEMEKFYSKVQMQFINNIRFEMKQKEGQEQRPKSFVGSLNYLSPQSLSLQYSQASDIWSFGILVYKMFHDRLPFEGESPYEIMKKIMQGCIKFNQNLEPDLKDMIMKCLDQDPTKRPTAEELKKHPYFKGINWQNIYQNSHPLSKQALEKILTNDEKQLNQKKSLKFEVKVEKRKLFGLYKPRTLKIFQKGEGLFMSYWRADGKQPRNEFQLTINDYAVPTTKNQFDVCNRDITYRFRTLKNQNPKQLVQQINLIIRKYYKLQ